VATDQTADSRSGLRRARHRRAYAVVLWWLFVAIFVYNALVAGQPIFWIPAALFGLGALATTRLALSAAAPERFTPEPGALRNARKGTIVETPAHWVPPGEGRPGTSRAGSLQVTDARLSFVTADGDVGFDAPIKKVRLVTVPGFLRPQLDLELGGGVHTIRLFPIWDLGATFVGPVVAGEWYRQLRALGAS
jgi:hypothetical protein